MIKLTDLLKEDFGGGKYKLPKNHQPAMQVPHGGSCCANCRFFENDEEHGEWKCSNKMYQEWSGNVVLPFNPTEYCSDWWEPYQ
jgi:hypothetical protein